MDELPVARLLAVRKYAIETGDRSLQHESEQALHRAGHAIEEAVPPARLERAVPPRQRTTRKQR